jgi:hypothetical protein
MNLVMDWNCFSGQINQFHKPTFDDIYPMAKSMHYTCCKPFFGGDCARDTRSGQYWFSVEKEAMPLLQLDICEAKKVKEAKE